MQKNILKKNFKGMTIVEVLVAIAIFAILSLIVSTVFIFAAYNNMITAKMNKQMDSQTENVENKTGGVEFNSEKFIIDFGSSQFEVNGKKVIVGDSDDKVKFGYFEPDKTN